MRTRKRQPIRWGLAAFAAIWIFVIVPLSVAAAPYAAMVMDARSGEVLFANNADTRLHPASLTKMMTLYIVFEAVENGEIGLDTQVTISRDAASEPPGKLGLRAGQSIRLRYLIRAAAVKSANDAATALAEAIEGSEARFARRMNRTAKVLGMTRTTFRNAHGLTENGHLSTARDMTVLGRHVIYDYPRYYNLFSRITADAGVRTVRHTNRSFLAAYAGADGIKTGYTSAAGFNLTASAERGGTRIITTVFGGRSTATRNAKVAELMDLGFRRAPSRVALVRPTRPPYMGKVGSKDAPPAYGRKERLISAVAVKRSLRPRARPEQEPAIAAVVVAGADIEEAVRAAQRVRVEAEDIAAATETGIAPAARSADPVLVGETETGPLAASEDRLVERVSTSGDARDRLWGITVGRYPSQYEARKVLLQVALNEMSTLDGSLRKVRKRPGGYEANFMGMTRETAELACRRLQARNITCFMIQPAG